ncbi:hypothetical protein KDH_53850 [Dictyobacter sp. S3.2.2.5]|uniref:Uncharacterized protein n=1 Tax=Dictyobacter halimunensis TaxID=3026934 RepID=A0ABQ6G1C3_9CHLR|nr:hypothetical protein KDH_53850 [Dictyobacter sp. S3.2.2.5]
MFLLHIARYAGDMEDRGLCPRAPVKGLAAPCIPALSSIEGFMGMREVSTKTEALFFFADCLLYGIP